MKGAVTFVALLGFLQLQTQVGLLEAMTIDQKIMHAMDEGIRLSGVRAGGIVVDEDGLIHPPLTTIRLRELDIAVPEEEQNQTVTRSGPGTKRSEPGTEKIRVKRAGLAYTGYLWPDGVIPYELPPSITQQERDLILFSMSLIQQSTCVRFVVRSGQVDFVDISNSNSGCWSYVGVIGGGQGLNLGFGCFALDIVLHELIHAIGFYHEQSRTDRDGYVIIHWENIQEGYEGNFDKYDSNFLDSRNIPYDYWSTMHYGNWFFTSNGLPTISTLDPAFQELIGTIATFSFRDIAGINEMYNCASHCGVSPTYSTGPPEYYIDQYCNPQCVDDSDGYGIVLCPGVTPNSTPGTTTAPCVNERGDSWCDRRANLRRCSRSRFQSWCEKACDLC